LAYVRDISDRKQAADNLSKAQREWENIFQAIGQPTFIINFSHSILAVNQATLQACGLPLSDILGRKCYEIFHDPDSKICPKGCPAAKLLVTGKMETAELEFHSWKGFFRISCIPIFDNQGCLDQIIRVIAAGSGREAIAIYMEKGKSIDLVILDMIMPGIGGGKAFDVLLEIDPDVKVILSTGYSIDGEAQHIMNRGCKGFIQKPFRILDLTRKIREVL
jgi:CheY-like chemotaxis protein